MLLQALIRRRRCSSPKLLYHRSKKTIRVFSTDGIITPSWKTKYDDESSISLQDAMSQVLPNLDQSNIRNFSIIAHIDHGKSTLADRLLYISGNISSAEREEAQHLDSLQVERDRGITVKAQTASMLSYYNDQMYLLNLIDTPGHVDFSFEVNRSLSACEGALLLVDAAQGVQAQTLATYRAASSLGLTIVPVLTKIDMMNADPSERVLELAMLLDVDPESILLTSAKTGEGIESVLDAVIDRVPSPSQPSLDDSDAAARCLLLDSLYDAYRGIVCIVKVVDGSPSIRVGSKITSYFSKNSYDVAEVGLLLPHRTTVSVLNPGQVGYVICGMKSLQEAKVGDTLYAPSENVKPLTTFEEAKAMVFASIYPMDNSTFDDLRTAVNRLLLTDASVTVSVETSSALGMGFKVGFLGLLHMEVFRQRLVDEHSMQVLVTAPMVPYEIHSKGSVEIVEAASDFPSPLLKHQSVYEPTVQATIMTPVKFMGEILELLKVKRGVQTDLVYIDDERVSLVYTMPWQEVVTDFYDLLKSKSSGYATLTYEAREYVKSDIVKVNILLNGSEVDALSFVAHRSKANDLGKSLCKKLIKVIDRQQYEIIVQAALGVKVFAKERIPPFRKDVLIKSGKTVGGGDATRKQKLLAKQREGKKRMKTVSNIQLPQEAFWTVLSK